MHLINGPVPSLLANSCDTDGGRGSEKIEETPRGHRVQSSHQLLSCLLLEKSGSVSKNTNLKGLTLCIVCGVSNNGNPKGKQATPLA
jgi:hypothetical protein